MLDQGVVLVGGWDKGGVMRAFPRYLGLMAGAHLVLVGSDRPLLPTQGSL